MQLWFCLGWVFGIAWMGHGVAAWQCSAWAAAGGLVCAVILNRLVKSSQIWLRAAVGAALMCLGAVLGLGFSEKQLQQRLAHTVHEAGPAEALVYATEINALGSTSVQQAVEVLRPDRKPVQYLAYLSNPAEPDSPKLELGKYYRISGVLRPARSYASAGAFDQEKWLLQRNIQSGFKVKQAQELSRQQVYALGYADVLKRHASGSQRFFLWIEQQRLNFREYIQHLPVRNKGLLLALLTGDESLLDDSVTEQFQRYGMSHLLAISGPHVVIFAVLVCWMLKQMIQRFWPKLYLKVPRQYILLLPFLCCVFLYSAFAGFEIPALRTLLMSAAAVLTVLMRTKIQPFKMLLYSASLLLLLDPFSILSAAFWLSFGACFILLRIYQSLMHHQRELNQVMSGQARFMLALRLMAASQWRIFAALLPLTILFFQQYSWIAPLSNFIAIPWLSLLIVPLDIAAALSYYLLPPFSSMLFQLNDALLSAMLGLMNLGDRCFDPQLQRAELNQWMIVLLGFCLLMLFMPQGALPKGWAGLGLAVLLMKNLLPHPFELTVLDVGQGQSVFIREGRHSMMVDTGGSFDERKYSIGEQIILPFLSARAVSSLDSLVLTHLDQDHSGGYFSIQQKLNIKTLYASEQVEAPAAGEFDYCRRGQRWQLGQVMIEVLSPDNARPVRAGAERNENSCVLYVQLPQAQPYQRFLLMGDAGWKTEYQLLQHYPDLQADVLVLGHHGSRHSSSYAFLQQVRPKLAIASAGKFNRYGHPSGLTVERLKALNIPLLNTADSGSIQFVQRQGSIQLVLARDQRSWLQRIKAR